jgi:hypothetical protein
VEVATLKNTFFRFITLKYEMADETVEKFRPVNTRTIGHLLAMMPFVPKESIGCKYLIELERQYLIVLKYELR